MKVALGTVQFGLAYGIANTSGQVAHAEAKAMLDYARAEGLDTLDTAIAYGESEAVLGALGVDGFKIITKLPALPDDVQDVESWVRTQLHYSMGRLAVRHVFGVLLHRSQQLSGPRGPALASALAAIKQDGLAEKVGISIYAPDELESATKFCPIDLVQAPFNVLDRRLLTSGWLERLSHSGVEIHTRSVFLQGLLLMPQEGFPSKFLPWEAHWQRWHEWLEANEIDPVSACLAYPLSFSQIDRVVVGADTLAQLDQLVAATKSPMPKDLPDLTCEDEMLINPSNWLDL
jgi:aryl-alcohol dehydrogenase-like predicted oxidoreductase